MCHTRAERVDAKLKSASPCLCIYIRMRRVDTSAEDSTSAQQSRKERGPRGWCAPGLRFCVATLIVLNCARFYIFRLLSFLYMKIIHLADLEALPLFSMSRMAIFVKSKRRLKIAPRQDQPDFITMRKMRLYKSKGLRAVAARQLRASSHRTYIYVQMRRERLSQIKRSQ